MDNRPLTLFRKLLVIWYDGKSSRTRKLFDRRLVPDPDVELLPNNCYDRTDEEPNHQTSGKE